MFRKQFRFACQAISSRFATSQNISCHAESSKIFFARCFSNNSKHAPDCHKQILFVKQCFAKWPNGQTLDTKQVLNVWQTMFDLLANGCLPLEVTSQHFQNSFFFAVWKCNWNVHRLCKEDHLGIHRAGSLSVYYQQRKQVCFIRNKT